MTEHGPPHGSFALPLSPQVSGLRVGVAVADGLRIGPATEDLSRWCQERVSGVLANGMAGGDERREAVRAMIRAGGFKPSGRNKPAQEYLLRTATESGSLPPILNAVDVLNTISLQSGLPISLLSRARLGSSPQIRYGEPGEKFIFNRSGQELDVSGLLCVCGDAGPLGTPIKDSMLGKIQDDDRSVVAILYAPANSVSQDEVDDWAEQLTAALQEFCCPAEGS